MNRGLSEDIYQPLGMTALLDAVERAVDALASDWMN